MKHRHQSTRSLGKNPDDSMPNRLRVRRAEQLGMSASGRKQPFATNLFIETMPLLVLHGDRDQVIPIGIGRKLFEQARDSKTFITLEGANHNNLQLHSAQEFARTFIDSLYTD